MKINDMVTVDIESLAYGGEGVGRTQQKVVFVPLSSPGDRVQVTISESKRNYLRAQIHKFEILSQYRTVPLCDYFGECGGCQWQHIDYRYQLETKARIVRNSIERIAKSEEFEFLPILASPATFGYRSRARIQCSTGRKHLLGFFRANTNEVVPIDKCELLPAFLNQLLRKFNEFLNSNDYLIDFNDIEIMTNSRNEEGVLLLSAETFPKDQVSAFLKCLKNSIPTIYGVAIQTGQENDKRTEYFGNCSLEFSETIPLPGKDEPIPRTMRTHIDTFSQVNLEQNINLIRTVYEWIQPSGKETVVDLYCGMGNLSIPLARDVQRVIGIESNDHAVEDAVYNAENNRLDNCEFRKADAVAGVKEIQSDGTKVDVVLLDPPRKGCKTLIPELIACKPEKIIYVSCNPITLARDIGLLKYSNYRLTRVQAIDMFPQTYHVETVAELVLS